MFDPYTFTHILHGTGYYFFLWLVARALHLATRFLISIALESGWEVLENTSVVIERYRTQALAINYYGDSIINSIGDIFASMLGFYLASKLPVWTTTLIAVIIEIVLLVLIRDSLLLNIIMFIYPLEAINTWQTG